MVVVGVPGLEVRLVGEVSFRMMMSKNDTWGECLCDIVAANLVILHGRHGLAEVYSSVERICLQ